MVVPGELGQFLDHDGTRRHVDPDGEGLGREDHLDEALGKAGFDNLLEGGHHSCVVRSDTVLQLSDKPVIPEDIEVVRFQHGQP